MYLFINIVTIKLHRKMYMFIYLSLSIYLCLGEVKIDSGSGNTALLHNKIDKSIRILAETSENQKKMNKVLQDLIKYTGLMKQDSGKSYYIYFYYQFLVIRSECD